VSCRAVFASAASVKEPGSGTLCGNPPLLESSFQSHWREQLWGPCAIDRYLLLSEARLSLLGQKLRSFPRECAVRVLRQHLLDPLVSAVSVLDFALVLALNRPEMSTFSVSTRK
jgi:hypothetical protein